MLLLPRHKKSVDEALNCLMSFHVKALPLPLRALYGSVRMAQAPEPSIVFLAIKPLQPSWVIPLDFDPPFMEILLPKMTGPSPSEMIPLARSPLVSMELFIIITLELRTGSAPPDISTNHPTTIPLG